MLQCGSECSSKLMKFNLGLIRKSETVPKKKKKKYGFIRDAVKSHLICKGFGAITSENLAFDLCTVARSRDAARCSVMFSRWETGRLTHTAKNQCIKRGEESFSSSLCFPLLPPVLQQEDGAATQEFVLNQIFPGVTASVSLRHEQLFALHFRMWSS